MNGEEEDRAHRDFMERLRWSHRCLMEQVSVALAAGHAAVAAKELEQGATSAARVADMPSNTAEQEG